MDFKISIIPDLLKFTDFVPGNIYKSTFKIINSGRKKVTIDKICNPNHSDLSIKIHNENLINLSPGICCVVSVIFQPKVSEIINDQLSVIFKGQTMNLHILCKPPGPDLVISSSDINFGDLILQDGVVKKEIFIENKGSKSGVFKFSIKPDEYFVEIIPNNISIKPNSVQPVEIQIVPSKLGEFNIKIEGDFEGNNKSQHILLKGRISEFKLELYDKNTIPDMNIYVNKVSNNIDHNNSLNIPELNSNNNSISNTKLPFQMKCINFNPLYYGASSSKTVMVKNPGLKPINYIIALDDGDQCSTVINDSSKGKLAELYSTFDVIPNKMTLYPNQENSLIFGFHPKWIEPQVGFKSTLQVAPITNFSLLIKFLNVGSEYHALNRDCCLEIPLTATACPVEVSVTPIAEDFDFGVCLTGRTVEMQLCVKNESKYLPVHFKFQSLAHYHVYPQDGKIEAGGSIFVNLSFKPRQPGVLNGKLKLDFLGQVKEKLDCKNSVIGKIKTMEFSLKGIGQLLIPVDKNPKFNQGISPKITNEVGQYIDITEIDLKTGPYMARLLAKRNLEIAKSGSIVSFPNNRQRSIRPSERSKTFHTIFNKIPNHKYIDPTYEYTNEEIFKKELNKNFYSQLMTEFRKKRIANIINKRSIKYENNLDNGIYNEYYNRRPKLELIDLSKNDDIYQPLKYRIPLLKEIKQELHESEIQHNKTDYKISPTTALEKKDCKRMLDIFDLHKIIIRPQVINFGEVCKSSRNEMNIQITNCLDSFIHVTFDSNLVEMCNVNPWSIVITPKSTTNLTVIFIADKMGKIQRVVPFKINLFSSGCLTLFAEVVSPRLILSTNELCMPGLQSEMQIDPNCITRMIGIFNPLNATARFSWALLNANEPNSFTIKPAVGEIEAHSELQCQVQYLPSFDSYDKACFLLNVENGSPLKIDCVYKFTIPSKGSIYFVEAQTVFGLIPLNLPTTKISFIKNKGTTDAYFKINDDLVSLGLLVSPSSGFIKAGSSTQITLTLTPKYVQKFDWTLKVNIRCGQPINLRLSGSIEYPSVDIDISEFSFGGVYLNTAKSIPFTIRNLTNTLAFVELDLQENSEFHIESNNDKVECGTNEIGNFYIYIYGQNLVNCNLCFKPNKILMHNFKMICIINYTSSAYPPLVCMTKNKISKILSAHSLSRNLVAENSSIYPNCNVTATSMRPLVNICPHNLLFSVIYDDSELIQNFTLENISNSSFHWLLDCSDYEMIKGVSLLVEGMHTYLGKSTSGSLNSGEINSLKIYLRKDLLPTTNNIKNIKIPLYINDNIYDYISLTFNDQRPYIKFEPEIAFLNVVPLGIISSMTIKLKLFNYDRQPSITCDSKEKILTIEFIGQSLHRNVFEVLFKLNFISQKPIAIKNNIIFMDNLGNRYPYTVSMVADNSIFSTYSYICLEGRIQNIICEQGKSLAGHSNIFTESPTGGEIQYVEQSRTNTQLTMYTPINNQFDIDGTSYSDELLDKQQKFDESIDYDFISNFFLQNSFTNTNQIYKFGNIILPSLLDTDDMDLVFFYKGMVTKLISWFSNFGWPQGWTSVHLPKTLQSGISKCKNIMESKLTSHNIQQEIRTIGELLTFITGSQLEKFPIKPVFSNCSKSRMEEIITQLRSFLDLLKSNGAKLILDHPEFLLCFEDYKTLHIFQHVISSGYNYVTDLNEFEFECVSIRSWIEVLLQMIKIFFLPKITSRILNNIPIPPSIQFNENLLVSNVYSSSERVLIFWMNHLHESHRKEVWRVNQSAILPSERWVVNFDKDLTDGVVLGTIFGVYMPFMIDSHISHMYACANTLEHCLHNCLLICDIITQMNMNIDIKPIDILKGNSIGMLLFVMQLAEILPQFLPKSIITMETILNYSSEKEVKISNPSKKLIKYHIKIISQSKQDFKIKDNLLDIITIPASSNMCITLCFVASSLLPRNAWLILTGMGRKPPNAIVFPICTNIVGVNPQIFNVETYCYQWKNFTIPVKNIVLPYHKFHVFIVEGDLIEYEKSNKKKNLEVACKEEHPVFFCSNIEVDLSVNANLNVIYIPTNIGKHYCHIVMRNDIYRDLVIKIQGVSTEPKVECLLGARVINGVDPHVFWKQDINSTYNYRLYFPVINLSRRDAFTKLAERILSDTQYNRLSNSNTLSSFIDHLSEQQDEIIYQVQCNNQCFFLPKKILLSSSEGNSFVTVPCSVTSNKLGLEECCIQLINENVPQDRRTFLVKCAIVPKNSSPKFQFNGYLHEAIVQDIPIINETNADWPIEVQINGSYFSGKSNFIAKARETTNYQLQFLPKKNDNIMAAEIIFSNKFDDSVEKYFAEGFIILPQPIGNLSFCTKVDQGLTSIIKVPNTIKRRLKYLVESDIPFIIGDCYITISDNGVGNYECCIKPSRRGTYTGIIKFTSTDENDPLFDSDGEEIELWPKNETWAGVVVLYTVDIHVEAGNPKDCIYVKSPCLTETNICLDIYNPVNTELDFEVYYEGLGLSGPNTFFVHACTMAEFLCKFMSFSIGVQTGRIFLYHEATGEFFYELTLEGEPIPPQTLSYISLEGKLQDKFVCEVGRFVEQDIVYYNPSQNCYILNLVNTNRNVYRVECSEFVNGTVSLSPFSIIKLTVIFSPMMLGTPQDGCNSATIGFKCLELGEWVYDIVGEGQPPQVQNTTSFEIGCNYNCTKDIIFKNPDSGPIIVDIFLDADNTVCNPFQICLKKLSQIFLDGQMIMKIPILFSPNTVDSFKCSICVRATRDLNKPWNDDAYNNESPVYQLEWIYPILGYSHIQNIVNSPIIIKCFVMKRLEKCFSLDIVGSVASSGGVKRELMWDQPNFLITTQLQPITSSIIDESLARTVDFTYELICQNKEIENELNRILTIHLLSYKTDNESGITQLEFKAVFFPVKSAKYQVLLMIKGCNGSRWEFPMNIICEKSPVDYEIIVHGKGLNQSVSQEFFLNSNEKIDMPFRVHIDKGSDSEISIIPLTGILRRADNTPSEFFISFTPCMYGKIYKAKFMIITESETWTYQIKGIEPEFCSPKYLPYAHPKESPVTQSSYKVNFIKENLKLKSTASCSPFKGAPLTRSNLF